MGAGRGRDMRATERTIDAHLAADTLTTTTPFDTLALPMSASLMRRVAVRVVCRWCRFAFRAEVCHLTTLG